MDISFKGFNTLGAQRYQIKPANILGVQQHPTKPAKKHKHKHNKPTDLLIINFKITDDARGKDLSTFNELFPGEHEPIEDIHLKFWKYKENPHGEFDKNILSLNNKEYELNDNNLGVFQVIAQFLQKVITASDEYLQVSSIDKEYCSKNFIVNVYKENCEKDLEALFDCKNIKGICQDMLKSIEIDVVEFMDPTKNR